MHRVRKMSVQLRYVPYLFCNVLSCVANNGDQFLLYFMYVLCM